MEMSKKEWEMQCYGCSEAALLEALEDAFDPVMLATSILSDAQELISGEFGKPDTERARKYMNRAKFILFNAKRNEREAA